jgi:hypothetical protein
MNIKEYKVYEENSITTASIKRKKKDIIYERMRIINDSIINKNVKSKDLLKSFIKRGNPIDEEKSLNKLLSDEEYIDILYYKMCRYTNMHNLILENFEIRFRLIKLFEPYYMFIRKMEYLLKLDFNDKFILELVKYLTKDYNDFFINIIKGDESYIDEYIKKNKIGIPKDFDLYKKVDIGKDNTNENMNENIKVIECEIMQCDDIMSIYDVLKKSKMSSVDNFHGDIIKWSTERCLQNIPSFHIFISRYELATHIDCVFENMKSLIYKQDHKQFCDLFLEFCLFSGKYLLQILFSCVEKNHDFMEPFMKTLLLKEKYLLNGFSVFSDKKNKYYITRHNLFMCYLRIFGFFLKRINMVKKITN